MSNTGDNGGRDESMSQSTLVTYRRRLTKVNNKPVLRPVRMVMSSEWYAQFRRGHSRGWSYRMFPFRTAASMRQSERLPRKMARILRRAKRAS